MLAIAVAIIAVPSRPIRRIGLEKAVDNGDALEDQRIVGLPEAEPHELEEIRPDHLAGGDPRMVGAIAERDRLPAQCRGPRASARCWHSRNLRDRAPKLGHLPAGTRHPRQAPRWRQPG